MEANIPTQQSLAAAARVSGKGLFLGQPVTVTFKPAPDNHGIVFVRQDLDGAEIPALVHNVVKRSRRTSLRNGAATVDTTEHCLSALAGLRIDNLIVELDGPELPGLDGSAQPYVDALLSAGLQAGTQPRRQLVLEEPVFVRQDDSTLAALPSQDPGLQLLYELDYAAHPAIGRQLRFFDLEKTAYATQIAPARTFILEQEVAALRARGFGAHLTPQDLVVVGPTGPLGGNSFRFPDEPVRHKILDLLGDLYLLGAPLQARVIAVKSGHALNHALVRELTKKLRAQVQQQLALKRQAIDIRKLFKLLPHRYPMLLVDRVLEIEPGRRALGVKNVTINEPFFQGHYPGTPIMPGVLIVEAMAQLAGVLMCDRMEATGKVPALLSLDRVKLRRPVVPGDQLILEAEAARWRSTVAHLRCRAYVGQEIAAEAEVKFMLVDEQQV